MLIVKRERLAGGFHCGSSGRSDQSRDMLCRFGCEGDAEEELEAVIVLGRDLKRGGACVSDGR